MKRWTLALAMVSVLSYACGGDDSAAPSPDGGGAVDATATDGSPSDAGPGDGGIDNGEASTTYPAFKPSVPTIKLVSGGAVMPTPKIRAVYFSGETLAAQIDAPVTAWLASPIWTAQTSEYGIGAATWTSTTLTETPPATIDDNGIQAWLQAKLGGGGGDAGADAGADPAFGPTDQTTLQDTIFIVFYPSTTVVSAFGEALCASGIGGYHSEIAVAGKAVSYAVVPRCSATAPALVQSSMFLAIATASDPLPTTQPAWAAFDADHAVWQLAFFGSELPMPCQNDPPAMIDGGAFLRSWSNAASTAYHDPCVPTGTTTPYFASVPIMNDTVVVNGSVNVRGVKAAIGQSKTVEVQLWSDGPTSGPWSVDAMAPLNGLPGKATFAFDRTSGTNGEKLHLTITPTVAGTQWFVLTSTLGTKKTYWAGAFGQ